MSARARHAAQVDDFPRAPPRREGPEITSPRSGGADSSPPRREGPSKSPLLS